jgi:hypothetical protein
VGWWVRSGVVGYWFMGTVGGVSSGVFVLVVWVVDMGVKREMGSHGLRLE